MLLQMEEQQGVTPPALERRPTLDDTLAWRVTEFSRLSRDRAYTDNGPLPLTTGSIRTYYDAFRLHDHCFDNFYSWMTELDDIWMEEVTKQRERALKAPKSKSK